MIDTPDQPPPDVFTQEDRPPAPPVVLRVRVVLPWGNLPYREVGASSDGGGRWELSRDEDEENYEDEVERVETSWGAFDADGVGSLTAEDLALWSAVPLRITAASCREIVIRAPPLPLPSTLVVRMQPDGATKRFCGRIRDERGAPLQSAGVFLEDAEWQAGTQTATDGTFELRVPADVADDSSRRDDGDRVYVPLLAVAEGCMAATVRARASGEEGLDITLSRDTVHGRLELGLLKADGTPASGARAWLYPASLSFNERFSLRPPGPEGGAARTRRFLPRVTGGASVDAQGLEVIQGDTLLLDLVADDDGQLLLPALQPGTWRIRAVLGARTGQSSWQPGIYDIHVRQCAEATVEVRAPPTVTKAAIQLRVARSVTGVIDVRGNATWHCDHDSHVHFVRVQEQLWSQVRVRSGRYKLDGKVQTYSGRFRFDGLPNQACRLVVHTLGHPDVELQLPHAEATADGTDIGTILVPDARMMTVEVVAFDGTELVNWDGNVELQCMPGKQVERPWSISGGREFRFLLTAAPPPTARLVVRLAGRPEPVAIVHAPFRIQSGESIQVHLPR